MSHDVSAYDEPGLHLVDMEFTDLYLNEHGFAKIRGLSRSEGESWNTVEGPLTNVPTGAIADLELLRTHVFQMGRTKNEFTVDFEDVRYRVARIDAQEGVTYTLRRQMHPIPRLGSMVTIRPLLRELARLGGKDAKGGLILMSGATGSGKTTVASSLLQEYLFKFGDIAVTIEDPPELRLEGEYGEGIGYCYQTAVVDGNWAEPLRRCLRFTPRYIFVGEIREPDAASSALQLANSGHVVITTVHGGSIQEALTRILTLAQARTPSDIVKSQLAEGLSAVFCQRLRTFRSGNQIFRRPVLQSLFFGDDGGLRAKVRDGKFELLATDIAAQAARMNTDQQPVTVRKGRP